MSKPFRSTKTSGAAAEAGEKQPASSAATGPILRALLGRKGKMLGGIFLAAGLIVQLIPVPGENVSAAAPERAMETHLPMPESVKTVFDKACRDCHTNGTRWPWYGRVAPVSWMLAHDVGKARAAVNFSEWTTQSGRTPAKAIATLNAACANMQSGRMPLKGYQMMHPESRLGKTEIGIFCEWTKEQTKALILAKRKSPGAGQP